MENTQEKEMAYLAGIIDGEGCISLTLQQYRKGRYRIMPAVSVSNTNKTLVEYLHGLLVKYGVRHHIYWHSETQKQLAWANITVHAFDCIINLLEAIQSYLVAKARQAANVLAFTQSRMMSNGKAIRNGKTFPYTLEHFQLLSETKSLNHRKHKEAVLDPQRLHAEYCKLKDAVKI